MKSTIFTCLFFIALTGAQSPCDEVQFVNRAGWNAKEPTSIANLTSKPLSFYVIHHTYQPPNCYDDASCIDRVQSIQNTHQNTQGWADIGYHFLVGENGKVYEGRGWDRQAAHSPGWNNDAYGICIIGDFQVSSPNEKALKTARSWMECGVKLGHVNPDYYIITHRQSQPPGYTVCPGNGTFEVVKNWPRFCSFQNSRANLTDNQTQLSIALKFCASNVALISSIHVNLLLVVVLFHLLMMYYVYN